MNKYICILFLLCITFTSCKKTEKKGSEIKPNDEFRAEALSILEIQEDTAIVFNTLLEKLDSHGITYGTFYKKRLYDIEDSCYQSNKNILDSLNVTNTDLYCYYIDSIRNKAAHEYQNQLSISDHELDIVLYVTTSNPSIKVYLNQKYGLNLFIPEEE